MKEQIKNKIYNGIKNCHYIDIQSTDNVHFLVHIVSDTFIGLSLVQRHRFVYDLLDFSEIHAVQVETQTIAEWEESSY